MLMLSRRLQVLLDDERALRLQHEAQRRGVAVAVLVREAIDAAYPSEMGSRARAAKEILRAEPMEVPEIAGLLTELDGLRGRRV